MGTGNGYMDGRRAGELGRPIPPQGNMPYTVYQNFQTGHKDGSKK